MVEQVFFIMFVALGFISVIWAIINQKKPHDVLEEWGEPVEALAGTEPKERALLRPFETMGATIDSSSAGHYDISWEDQARGRITATMHAHVVVKRKEHDRDNIPYWHADYMTTFRFSRPDVEARGTLSTSRDARDRSRTLSEPYYLSYDHIVSHRDMIERAYLTLPSARVIEVDPLDALTTFMPGSKWEECAALLEPHALTTNLLRHVAVRDATITLTYQGMSDLNEEISETSHSVDKVICHAMSLADCVDIQQDSPVEHALAMMMREGSRWRTARSIGVVLYLESAGEIDIFTQPESPSFYDSLTAHDPDHWDYDLFIEMLPPEFFERVEVDALAQIIGQTDHDRAVRALESRARLDEVLFQQDLELTYRLGTLATKLASGEQEPSLSLLSLAPKEEFVPMLRVLAVAPSTPGWDARKLASFLTRLAKKEHRDLHTWYAELKESTREDKGTLTAIEAAYGVLFESERERLPFVWEAEIIRADEARDQDATLWHEAVSRARLEDIVAWLAQSTGSPHELLAVLDAMITHRDYAVDVEHDARLRLDALARLRPLLSEPLTRAMYEQLDALFERLLVFGADMFDVDGADYERALRDYIHHVSTAAPRPSANRALQHIARHDFPDSLTTATRRELSHMIESITRDLIERLGSQKGGGLSVAGPDAAGGLSVHDATE